MVYYSSHQSSIYWNNSSLHWKEIFNLLRCKVWWVLEAVSGFTNPFSSSFEDNELYFLSFGVPAKPGIAKDFIEAEWHWQEGCCKLHWLTFSWKSVFHNPIKCYKLIQFWGLRGQEEISNLHYVISQNNLKRFETDSEQSLNLMTIAKITTSKL